MDKQAIRIATSAGKQSAGKSMLLKISVTGRLFCLLGGLLLTALAQADSLQAQRDRYAELIHARDKGDTATVAKLLPQLQDYPLYPYLLYRQINDQINTLPVTDIEQFLHDYPDFVVNDRLISLFVNELARRKEWQQLLIFSPQPPNSSSAQCNYYMAKLFTGEKEVAWQGSRILWRDNKIATGDKQPAACKALFAAWQTSGSMHVTDYQYRIVEQIKRGNWQQVAVLAAQMPVKTEVSALQALIKVQDQIDKVPDQILTFVRQLPAEAFRYQVAEQMFRRLAGKDVAKSQRFLPVLQTALQADTTQRQQLAEIQAWQLMSNNVSRQQAQWRDQVIHDSRSGPLIERRIRLALSAGDMVALGLWLHKLPVTDQQKDEWRYWQAAVLQQQEQTAQATTLLQTLSTGRGFYPMLAARQLNQPYAFKTEQADPPDTALLQRPALARVIELKYWQQETSMLREWRSLVLSLPSQQQASLAYYALQQQWWDLSVQATIIGKLWNHLQLRFPLAYQELFRHNLAGKTLPLSYTLAIARQESAWNPRVRSPAGATGLMQLMPATARHTAKKFNIGNYRHFSQLQEPALNVEIGTQYLQFVYDQFGENRVLAAAAYNAGPSRVTGWLARSNGKLNVVAFIESIPFTETRGYVKNVLAYDAYYRHFMQQPALDLFTSAEWQRAY